MRFTHTRRPSRQSKTSSTLPSLVGKEKREKKTTTPRASADRFKSDKRWSRGLEREAWLRINRQTPSREFVPTGLRRHALLLSNTTRWRPADCQKGKIVGRQVLFKNCPAKMIRGSTSSLQLLRLLSINRCAVLYERDQDRRGSDHERGANYQDKTKWLTRRIACGRGASGNRCRRCSSVYGRCRKMIHYSSWRSIAAWLWDEKSLPAGWFPPLPNRLVHGNVAACDVGGDSSSRWPSGRPRRECPDRWARSLASYPHPPWLGLDPPEKNKRPEPCTPQFNMPCNR